MAADAKADASAFDVLQARISAAERGTLLSRQSTQKLEASRKALQEELTRVKATTARQQEMCRELQSSMRTLGGEELDEEEETVRRSQLEDQFEGTVGNFDERVKEQEAEVQKLTDDNRRSSEALETFRGQHAAVLKHQAAEAHMRDLQDKLAVAQIREGEQVVHQQAQRLRLVEAHFRQQEAAEASVREQVEAYDTRFEQIDETLSKSNEVFGQLQEQAAAAEKRAEEQKGANAELEAKAARSRARGEAALQRCEALRLETRRLLDEKEALAAECRTLQAERTRVMQQLATEGGGTAELGLESGAASVAVDS